MSIDKFRDSVSGAAIEEVDEPSDRKKIEIAYLASYGFEVETGEAYGIYFEPDRTSTERVHIDWVNGERTSVEWGDVEYLKEGDYYND